MRKQKIKEVLWGIGLVGAAAFIIMNQLHILSFHLGVGTIIWTIIFGITLINSIAGKNIFGMVFSIAFLLIVYAEPLHITQIVPWTLLLAACLVYAGLCLIFPKNWYHSATFFVNSRRNNDSWQDGEFTSTKREFNNNGNDERDVVINQKLSEVSRYVHSQNLETVTINSTMGETSVYLDSAKPAGDTVTIDINSSMGEVSIFLPQSWKVEDHLSAIFGEVEINGAPRGKGPTVILQGSSRFGSISINYV